MKLTKLINYSLSPRGATELLILLLWGYELMIFLRAPFLHLPLFKDIASIVIPYLFLFLFSFLGISYWGKRIRLSDYLFCIAIAFIYLLNYIIYPHNTNGLDEYVFTFLVKVLPFFLVGLLIDISRLFKWFYYISVITIILTVFYDFYYTKTADYRGSAEQLAYYMSRSYALLAHVIMVLWATLKKPSKLNIILSALGIFVIFSYGTRGPLICLIFFLLAYLFFVLRLIKIKYVFLIVAFSSVVFFQNDILKIMYNVSSQFGMSSRIFDKIQEGTFIGIAASSGRDEIAKNLMNKISQNNGMGFGIRGIGEGYAHNIFIDFWFEFGFYLGSILLFMILLTIIKGYKNCRLDIEKGFWLLLFSRGFVQLLVSNTYLNAPFLFILLGYCIRIYRTAKSNKV